MAQQEVDPTLEAAKRLAVTMNMEQQMNNGFDAMLPVIHQQATALNLNAEQSKKLEALFRTWFIEDIDRKKMVDQLIEQYAQNFTASELDELSAFYKTAIGQKWLLLMPTLTQEGAKMGIQEAKAKQHLLQERVETFMAEIQKEGAAKPE